MTEDINAIRARNEANREAHRVAALARQEAYRASPEYREARLARINSGLCVIDDDQCVTHGVPGDFGHYLDTRPAEDRGHNPVSGIAYND